MQPLRCGRAPGAVFLVVLACLPSLIGPGPASAGREDPSIKPDQAWLESADALLHKFGDGFKFGHALAMRCNKRIARNVIRCRPEWRAFGNSYWGHLYVAYQTKKATGRTKAVVDGKMRWWDRAYCMKELGGGRDECTRRFRVHDSGPPVFVPVEPIPSP